MSYEELRPKLDAFVKANKVVLFMKGDPEAPKCGFSKKVVETLKKEGRDGREEIVIESRVRCGVVRPHEYIG